MKHLAQNIEDILGSLQPMSVDWQDDVVRRVIKEIESIPTKAAYTDGDLRALLGKNFDDALLIFRSFLAQSKDDFTGALGGALKGPAGVTAYKRDPGAFVQALVDLGVLEAMAEQINRAAKWSDVLVERLRSGRGSAITGQKRGRGLEDTVEEIIRGVFGGDYVKRCNFEGPKNKTAKCDFAVHGRKDPHIIVEVKAYGATGSKMTDVIGDVEKIIAAKRSDAALLFFTDGVTWRQRKADLAKLVKYQNEGDIRRIYTQAMAAQFEKDLEELKRNYGL